MTGHRMLCVANYSAATSYAWRTIHTLYAVLGARLARRGVETLVVHREPSSGDGIEPRSGYGHVREGYDNEQDLLRLVRKHRVDVCHLTDGPLIGTLYRRLRRAGARVILMHVRSSGERTVPRGLRRTIKGAAARLPSLTASRYVAVSDFVQRRLLDSGCLPPHRVVRIHNGIDVGRFSGAADGYARGLVGAGGDTPLLFTAARANQYKGIGVLIDALALLRDRGGPPVQAVYCGDGPDLDRFRQAVQTRGLEASFHLLGERDDVDRILPGTTIAVVPSTWQEAFGLSVVEAMAAGVPVVASRVGGIPEILRHGENGLLVPPGDPAALATSIARLLEDRALRETLAGRARRDALDRFSLERVAVELDGLLGGLGVGSSAA